MKNMRLAGLVLMVCGLLSSCLGESGHKIQLLGQPAVFVSDSIGYFLLKGGERVKYNTSFSAEDMDCFLINLNIDLYKDEDGIYDAELLGNPQPVERWGIKTSVTDTTVTGFYENERFFVTLNQKEGYILHQFFLVSTHAIVDSTEINNRYDLSFEPTQIGEFNNEVDATVYQLYLRAYEEKAGARVSNLKNRVEVNAFDLQSFYNAFVDLEKAKVASEMYFRIRYSKSFNTDTTAISWGESPVYSIPIVY